MVELFWKESLKIGHIIPQNILGLIDPFEGKVGLICTFPDPNYNNSHMPPGFEDKLLRSLGVKSPWITR